MVTIEQKIKILSVNGCWQGKRYKTPAYRNYSKTLLHVLPKHTIEHKNLYIIYRFYFSTPLLDIDNPIKPLQDILQLKYKFNDSCITHILATKSVVSKKNEGFKVIIGDANNFLNDIASLLKQN